MVKSLYILCYTSNEFVWLAQKLIFIGVINTIYYIFRDARFDRYHFFYQSIALASTPLYLNSEPIKIQIGIRSSSSYSVVKMKEINCSNNNNIVLGEGLASEEVNFVIPSHEFSKQAHVSSLQKVRFLFSHCRFDSMVSFWINFCECSMRRCMVSRWRIRPDFGLRLHRNFIGNRNGGNLFTPTISTFAMAKLIFRFIQIST